jgi:hypothetical protein
MFCNETFAAHNVIGRKRVDTTRVVGFRFP